MFINTELHNPQVQFCIRFLFRESIHNPLQGSPASAKKKKSIRGKHKSINQKCSWKLEAGSIIGPFAFLYFFRQQRFYYCTLLMVCPQSLLTQECCTWSHALGLEVTSYRERQRANRQFLKLGHHPRGYEAEYFSWLKEGRKGGNRQEEEEEKSSRHKGPSRSSYLSPWLTEEDAAPQRGTVTFLSSLDRRTRSQESLLGVFIASVAWILAYGLPVDSKLHKQSQLPVWASCVTTGDDDNDGGGKEAGHKWGK